jgi:hypothetical protein
MIYSNGLNFILFLIRMATLGIATILLFNLLSDWRKRSQEEKNGLRAARLALIWIIGALALENLVYAIGYIHTGFESVKLNLWLTNARIIIIFSRGAVLYGVFKLYQLFNHKKGE